MADPSPFCCRICDARSARVVLPEIRDWEFGTPGVWDYVECDGCGQISLSPLPTLDDLVDAYPASYIGHVESARARGWLYKVLYEIKEFFFARQLGQLVTPGARALDVGCGNGEFLTRLGALGAAQLEGIDFSERAVELARAKGVDAHLGVFPEFEGVPASYDLVVMYNYIEHTLDPHEELAKARTLLKPGGALIGEVPNFAGLDRRWFGRFWGGTHVPRHTYQFDEPKLREHLERAGFSEVRVLHELNPALVAVSLQNWLQRGVEDLADNPAIPNGRSPYFSLLLVASLPLNAVLALLRRSGIIRFIAVA